MSNKFTVGLILITEISGIKWGVLVRRGRHKIEKINSQKILLEESYPGLSQPTVFGGLNPQEIQTGEAGILQALKREGSEETNLNFLTIVRRMVCVQETQMSLSRSIIFAAFATQEEVLDLKFEPCKSLNLVREDEVDNIRTDAKREGFFKPGIAMFADDKTALRSALARFEELRKLFEQEGGGGGGGNDDKNSQ